MEFVFGMVIAAVIGGLAFSFLVPDKADRTALLKQLFKRFLPAPPPIVVEAPPPPPPPPPTAPPLKFGNILRVEGELDEPYTSECFVFPEKVAPTLSYDDFNRRLIVFTLQDGVSGPRPLFPTRISDEPIRLTGSALYLDHIIRKQFRPAYPVLVDGAGLFAAHSVLIEERPLHRPPIVSAILEIPEHERPVIFSITNQDQTVRREQFTFMRYGFEDYRFDHHFLGQDWTHSLPKTLEHFLGPADQWMYFSRARLRHALMLLDARSAKLAKDLADEIEAKRIKEARELDEREEDVRFDSYAHLFQRPNEAPPEKLQ